ncbi:nudix hydrolase-like protein 17 [Perilla frutescens var. hirtella]|uniref:Nudix hydrolase-like protein 17 n=1 Tax=Perilla frutescens var. hirtella TaxID=608512 RepID=A0AAD4JBZ6_PERFH|nr:nudix hydrolase-like protein 17 [Perilla frutescens var. frutescens]KAH6792691.1 nudix hydrolase-like protein 17 [Perilla frutescens var. hirtella]KAH6830927.1 nudix hydrolase-like protein 17 [Perilla frutescens var. hirtella]
MLCMAARTGRNMQRYSNQDHRLVVGCIPYRYKNVKINGRSEDHEFEVLVISSKKSEAMMFPKGGWESDESVEEAASRETLEEAGVLGKVECELGRWIFKSKSRELYRQGFMFPLLVTQQLDLWPEKTARKREWVSVSEAREACQQWWMKEALDILVNRLKSSTTV